MGELDLVVWGARIGQPGSCPERPTWWGPHTDPTEAATSFGRVSRRPGSSDDSGDLAAQVKELTVGLQALRREVNEHRAAVDDALDFVLAQTAHTSTVQLVADFREAGWIVTFGRRPGREDRGTICFHNPPDPVQDCTLDLPLPEDARERHKLENACRIRDRLDAGGLTSGLGDRRT